jgi:phenylacetic acid degradation operon negative regulatory protein
LIPFLFGVAGRDSLPGPVLVGLLGDLGLSSEAARTLIARLRREGQLASAPSGRTARYRLAGDLARGFERVRHPPTAPAMWAGHFHALLYQVPEAERAFRDQLRRIAVLRGFGILTSGVLISLTDRRHDMAGVLDHAPADARVYHATLAMNDNDAAQAAAQAWGLHELTRSYRNHLGVLHTAAREPAAATGAAALRRMNELLNPVLVDLLRAPALPAPLQPPDWPVPDLRQAILQIQGRYWPAVAAHVEHILRPWPESDRCAT